MGRKPKKQPKEGTRKSMKELTKDHEEFMKGRNSGRRLESDKGKENFEELLKKTVKKSR